MRLTDFILKDRIYLGLKGREKTSIIKEVVDALNQAGAITDPDLAKARILERESLEGTGIGRGIAIPHARCNASNEFVCALGVTRRGINFSAFDGLPVHAIFLMLYPQSESSKYLLFVSNLMMALKEEAFCEKMIAARKPEVVYEMFKRFDDTLAELAIVQSASTGAASKIKKTPAAKRVEGTSGELALVTRLQRLEQLAQIDGGQHDSLQEKINQTMSCIPSEILSHYRKLKSRYGLAVVPVEAGVCQGCNMKLSSQMVQELDSSEKVFTCPNCRRFLFSLQR